MTTNELINKGIGHNCLSDAYDLGVADGYNKAIDDCISYFEEHASEVWNHISARDFICDSLEELKVGIGNDKSNESTKR